MLLFIQVDVVEVDSYSAAAKDLFIDARVSLFKDFKEIPCG